MSQQPIDLPVAEYYHASDAGTVRFIRLIALWAIISGGAGTLQMVGTFGYFMLRPADFSQMGGVLAVLHWALSWPSAILMLLGGLACWQLRAVGRGLLMTAAALGVILSLFMFGMTLYTYLVRLPGPPRGFRIVYSMNSLTSALGSFAFPTVLFIFFTRPDVKQAMGR